MAFTLSEVVPWGRSFAEYRDMFALSNEDLAKRIIGCGDGPASFNALATERGHRVVSVDPIYEFSTEELAMRIKEVAPIIAEQTRRNEAEFVWTYFRCVDDLVAARMSAMSSFLRDYAHGIAGGRYVAASLPALPFPEEAFEVALCSHFLFLYSEHCDEAFHVRSILEMARVAREIRIFPLLELGSRPSRHVGAVSDAIRKAGLVVTLVPVEYEFQKGGHQMLRVSRLP